jgi:tetratricopeptide (TPR) repeat protein
MVMPYLEGVTLKDYLAQKGGRLPYEAIRDILLPVMDSLKEVHRVHLLHRDISPDNIFLTTSRQVKLIDFGAARYQAGEHSKSLSVILKTGYAPEEQYRSSGRQGPWTDVYAISATFYKAITGQAPPDALDRLEHDFLLPPSQLGVDIQPAAEQVLLKGLAVKAANRFQTIQDFQAALLGITTPAMVAPMAPASQTLSSPVEQFQTMQSMEPAAISRPLPPPIALTQVPRRPRSLLAILAPAVALIGIILVAILVWQGIKTPPIPQPDPKEREARIYLKQGIESYKTGTPEALKTALRSFEKAAELKSDLFETQYYLGLTLNQFGRNQEAAAAFSNVIAAKPDFAEAHYALSLTYIVLGKNEAAHEQYNILKNLNADLAKDLSFKLAHHLSPQPSPKPPETERLKRLDLAVLKNARYKVENEWITLKDGKFERGNSPGSDADFIRVYFEKAALGKFTDNATNDAAGVIYWYNGGGSGCFYQLGAVIMKDGKPINISTISLGDRVKINKLSISNNTIALDMFTHGPKDALANPSVRTTKKYKLSEDKLVLIPSSQGRAKIQQADNNRRLLKKGPTLPPPKPTVETTRPSAVNVDKVFDFEPERPRLK